MEKKMTLNKMKLKSLTKEEFGLRLFLSLALQQTINEAPKEGNEIMKQWMEEQLAMSAEVLFPEPFEA